LPGEYGRGLSSGKTWEQTSNIFAGYVQDTWRLTDRLTLNIGLRYEAHTPWVETNDQQAKLQPENAADRVRGPERRQPRAI
jgi:outer membrane receptor for monomeric catechols